MKAIFSLTYRFLTALLLTALLLAREGVRPGYAATFTVNTTNDTVDANPGNGICADSSGNCSLRAAIMENNALGGNNTVILPAGTYQLTLPGNEDSSVSDDLDINASLSLTGAGAGSTIIQQTVSGMRVLQVASGATVYLDGVTITGGSESLGGGGSGVYNEGTLSISNSVISGNTMTNNGGGVRNSGTLTLTNSTVSNNSANLSGGGVWNTGTLTIINSTFLNNTAVMWHGGGVWNNGTATITNSTFSGNSATSNGGGVWNDGGTLTILNSTFSGNSASFGPGGIRVFGGTVTLKNTLIANSTGGDCVGAVSSSSINNLIEDSTSNCGLSHNVNGNIIGFDPNLGALTGSPAYFPLNAGSPAIDAGSNPTCAAYPVNNQSQNGVTRPKDGNGDNVAVCDIGSYEAPATGLPTVVSITRADPNPTTAPSVNFTVTFSEAVINVDSGDFTLTTTGSVSGAGVSSVSGSGNTRTVTVNTGTGYGTIRLDVPNSATVNDIAGNPLSGLPFTGGEVYQKGYFLFLPLVMR